jgi:hypothetical protein
METTPAYVCDVSKKLVGKRLDHSFFVVAHDRPEHVSEKFRMSFRRMLGSFVRDYKKAMIKAFSVSHQPVPH